MAKGQQLPFYPLVDLLFKIGEEVALTERLLEQGQDLRKEKKKTKDKNDALQRFWERNANTPVQQALVMVRELANLIKPTPSFRDEDIDRLPDEIEDE